MQVLINGSGAEFEQPLSVHDLIERLGIEGRFAVEINQQIIPRSTFSRQVIHEGDVIEIVQAIGGG